MGIVTPLRPMADGRLIAFFMNESIGLSGKRLRRVEAAHRDLLICFGEHLPAVLGDVGGDDGQRSTARSAPVRTILDVLPFFLDESRWHGTDLRDRVVRADLAWSLAVRVARELDLTGGESYEAVRTAVHRSRIDVRRAKLEQSRRELEARAVHSESARQTLAALDRVAAMADGWRCAAAKTRADADAPAQVEGPLRGPHEEHAGP